MGKGGRSKLEERVLSQYNEALSKKKDFDESKALIPLNESTSPNNENNEASVEMLDIPQLEDLPMDLSALLDMARSQMTFNENVVEEVDEFISTVRPDWTFRYHLVAQQCHSERLSVPLVDLPIRLSPAMLSTLTSMNITSAFAIQRAVFPFLMPKISSLEGPNGLIPAFHSVKSAHLTSSTCDVCVAAPTGQGKTLCFSVPLIHSLEGRLRPCLRAIVVLPTKDLALQVFKIISDLANGINSFNRRQFKNSNQQDAESQRENKGASNSAFLAPPIVVSALVGSLSCAEEESMVRSRGSTWAVPDIIVCTPGRLVELASRLDEGDEERETGVSFRKTFQFLETIVIDEADRTLSQPVVGWQTFIRRVDNLKNENSVRGIRKWLFSATLTHNAEHLASINLQRPLFFMTAATRKSAEEKLQASNDAEVNTVMKASLPGIHNKEEEEDNITGFSLPSELTQRYAVCFDADLKIAVCCWVILRRWMDIELTNSNNTSTKDHKVVVFCATKATSHRLSRLIQLLFSIDPLEVVRFSDKWTLGHLGSPVPPSTTESLDELVGMNDEEDVDMNDEEEGEEYYDYDEEELNALKRKKKKMLKESRRKDKKQNQEIQARQQNEIEIRQNILDEGLKSDLGRSLSLFLYLSQHGFGKKLNSPNLNACVWDFTADLSQSTRIQVLRSFKSVSRGILVCSDIAARGLDIENLDLVINYDLPSNSRRYVHRAGRTARAGRQGEVLSLVCPNEISHLNRITKEFGGMSKLIKQTTPKRALGDVTRFSESALKLLRFLVDLEDTGRADKTKEVNSMVLLRQMAAAAGNPWDEQKRIIFRPLWGLKFEVQPRERTERKLDTVVEENQMEDQVADEEINENVSNEPPYTNNNEDAEKVGMHEEQNENEGEDIKRREEKKEKRKREKEEARKKKRRRHDDDSD